MLKINKLNKKYNNIREMNIINKKKFKNIIFNKYVIINEIFYHIFFSLSI